MASIISKILVAISFTLLALAINGQMTPSPCPSLISPTTLTPCLNYITGSSPNGGSPTADCCNIMKSVVGGGVGCLCFVASGGVPFQIPISRNLTLSLPRACQMPGVSVKCTDPVASAPTMSPIPAPGPSRGVAGDAIHKPLSPSISPESNAIPTLTPPSPTTNTDSPATNSGRRVSPAPPSLSPSTFLLLGVLGALAIKLY